MLDFSIYIACLLLCLPYATPSPVRRYTNSTVAPADCPDESQAITATSSSSSSTPFFVNGPTPLATSILSPVVSSQSSSAQAQALSTAPITFSYAPISPNVTGSTYATGSSSQTGSKSSSPDAPSIVTTYTTVTPSLTIPSTSSSTAQPASASSPSSGPNGPGFSYAPLPFWTSTTASLSSISPTQATPIATNQPYFSATPSSPASQSSSAYQPSFAYPTPLNSAHALSSLATAYAPDRPTTSPALPEIITASPASSGTGAPAGITIIPLHPSVIYITTTVTDAGATTTVGSEIVTVTAR